jgi:uncharacterized protein YdhG (YjbR/CyaY superfamily)
MMGTRRARPPATIDAYIAGCPSKVQSILHRIRHSVQDIAPEAEEMISYRMPAFRQGSMLIYFAAFKNHIGIFPPVRGDAKLERAVARYSGAKGNLRFPLDEPIPYDLIKRIVKLRLKQATAKAAAEDRA